MGCPVHIWAPLMAGLVPVARLARDRLPFGHGRRSEAPAAPRTLQRFAPIVPGASTPEPPSPPAP